ncbi:unnamed protein product [Miscanthus lutarioriparius]|uniref:Uncharacterized protein n=1 Tax=Miscanthus lutarioriparius TaxID=422564 RepID=A0A811M9Y2_9POAL|nr:unnamed protein product [Miscanthus lutarioriparius]
MDGGDGSPVMTDSERRAYWYGHRASPRLPGMRKSWSNDSLAGYGGGGRASCVCAPTTHPGSFRCKHHRHASNLGAAATAQVIDEAPAADADAKHNEQEGQETAPAADQVDKSS